MKNILMERHLTIENYTISDLYFCYKFAAEYTYIYINIVEVMTRHQKLLLICIKLRSFALIFAVNRSECFVENKNII